MHFRDDLLRASVAIGEAGQDLLIAFHKHVIHAPCVDREADDIVKLCLGFFDALINATDKGFDIPDEVPVKLTNSVRESVDLFCPELAVLHPADYVAPG